MADVDRCLDFIACQHPKLHSSSLDVVDSLAHVILELVFDGRRSDQIEFDFKFLGHLVDSFFFVNRSRSFLVLLRPCIILALTNLFRSNEQSPKSHLCVSI